MSYNNKTEINLPGLSADQSTNASSIEEFLYYSGQFSWTNGAAFSADIKIQISNDTENWVDLPGTSMSISGASGSHIWEISSTSMAYTRIDISSVAGTADANIDLVFKSVDSNR